MNRINSNLCRIVWLVFALTLVSGCGVGAGAPREGYDPPFSEQVLESLLGSTKDEVEERLGKPAYQTSKGGKSYFVYRGDIKTVGFIVGFPTLPLWDDSPVCSLLEFDFDERFERYERVGGSGVLLLVVAVGGAPADCRDAFWSEEELAEFEATHREILKKRADTGEPDAMYQYANQLPFGVVPERLRWYCRAAHAGQAKARHQLSRYYEQGVAIERNSVRAYVWYTLSSKAGYAHANKMTLSQDMTPAQITEAERLVAEWEPNPAECEEIAAQSERVQVRRRERVEQVAWYSSLEKEELKPLAEKGDPEAQWQLANRQSPQRQLWLCRAAYGGHPHAQYRLGSFYRYGLSGLNQDIEQPYKWYTLASGNSHLAASRELEIISGRMTSSQIAEAERLAARWEPNPAECEEIAAQPAN